MRCEYCESSFLAPTTLEKHYAAKHPGKDTVRLSGMVVHAEPSGIRFDPRIIMIMIRMLLLLSIKH